MKGLTSYPLLGEDSATVLSLENLTYALDPSTGALDLERLETSDQNRIQIFADPYVANAVVAYLRGSEMQKQKIRNFCIVQNSTICINMDGYIPVEDYLPAQDEFARGYVKSQLQLQMAFNSVEAHPENWISKALTA